MANDWLPEEFRADPSVKDVPDLPTLIKNYKEAQSYQGQSIRIPGENAAEADRAAFQEKLRAKVPDLILAKDEKGVARAFGVPEKADEYPVPEEAKLSEEETKAFRERAASLGLSKKQAETALKAELLQRANAANAIKENMAAIEKEWGAATKDRLDKLAVIAERFGYDKGWVQSIKEGKVPLNALIPFQKMVDSLGSEGNNLGKNSSQTAGPLTPLEAERQLAELTKNPAFLNPKDPTYPHLQREFFRLTALSMGLEKVPEPYIHR